ncbi:MAG TPA: DUF1415 family protein [Saprospiraceae bacterium]|nr:DUF1415 family protein [Saprospiraceae bacterium]
MESNGPVTYTQKWIEEFVIAYALCPFASQSFYNQQIIYKISESCLWEDMAMDFAIYVLELQGNMEDFSNAFILYPNYSVSFEDFYEFSFLCEDILKETNLDPIFQIVVFHPDFKYQHEPPDSHVHFTNRSPYPMIHILKVREVSKAISSSKNIDKVSIRNKEILEQMPRDVLQKQWVRYHSESKT